tara:strand:+ start:1024 stop:1197 length:174 start_codon:yes stop_codon:yes gene_type:complete
MKYLIIRNDGEKDSISGNIFDNYDEAYEILEKVYSDICCSDADYDDRPYYEIIEICD